MNFDFDAQVTAALFDRTGAVFALGDGSVRFDDRTVVQAHDGAALCAAVHPSGEGVVTGGDDGQVVWSRRDADAVVLASARNQWIDSIDAAAASGLIAFSFGRTLAVIEAAGLFCVNTLPGDGLDLAEIFASRRGIEGEARFARRNWTTLATGAPVLTDAVAAFDCRLTAVQDVATHRILLGEVVGLGGATAAPDRSLIYRQRQFQAV